MAVTITDQQRDGVLCTVTATITDNANATTTNTIVGHIVQIVINRTSGSESFDLQLDDTTNSMMLYSGSSLADTDITPNNLNSGSGAYCRGPLKITTTSTNNENWTVVIYYIKM